MPTDLADRTRLAANLYGLQPDTEDRWLAHVADCDHCGPGRATWCEAGRLLWLENIAAISRATGLPDHLAQNADLSTDATD